MNWYEIGLLGSIVFVMYYFQQIKMALKSEGYHVDLFTGWISDFKRFKTLIENETDMQKKTDYQGILNGFYLALAGMAVLAYLRFSGS
jgi:hypothetical protein